MTIELLLRILLLTSFIFGVALLIVAILLALVIVPFTLFLMDKAERDGLFDLFHDNEEEQDADEEV